MTVAVVGASGLTGSAFCDIAADKLPRLRLIGKSTVGTRVTLAGKTYVIEGEEALDKSCDYAMFFTDEQTSRRLVPKAALNGAVCIDNSCAFRMHRDVPLVVPKVNGGDVGRCKVIANPNCTAIQIAIALNCVKSLGIEEVTAVTFQAASGAGREGLADLRQNRGYGKLRAFAHPLCDNVIGQIGEILPDGTTTEEQKLRLELPKILHEKQLEVNSFCARVPVSVGHCAFVSVALRQSFDLDKVCDMFTGKDLLLYRQGLPQPLALRHTHVVGVGRLSKFRNRLNMFVVADNLLTGAAYNAFEILRIAMENNKC